MMPSPSIVGDKLAISIPEAAKRVGVSARYLWSERDAGRLIVARAGSRVLVPVTELQRWLDARIAA